MLLAAAHTAVLPESQHFWFACVRATGVVVKMRPGLDGGCLGSGSVGSSDVGGSEGIGGRLALGGGGSGDLGGVLFLLLILRLAERDLLLRLPLQSLLLKPQALGLVLGRLAVGRENWG